jgi:hypothetical protein
MSEPIVLDWHRYNRLTEARQVVGTSSVVYVQADPTGKPLRVGKASKGLHARYRGGTGWAIDAAMHASQNVIFVAKVDAEVVDAVEATLIWTHREQLPYNNIGKRVAPILLRVEHRGDVPSGF